MDAWPRFKEMCTELGYVAYLNSRVSKRYSFPIGALRAWIEPPILLRQVRFVFDDKGDVIGYYTWAFLTPENSRRMIDDRVVVFHLSEWKEGEDLWLMDFVPLPGQARSIAQKVMSELACAGDFMYLRRGERGKIRKVVHVRHPHTRTDD